VKVEKALGLVQQIQSSLWSIVDKRPGHSRAFEATVSDADLSTIGPDVRKNSQWLWIAETGESFHNEPEQR
jgi:hypothetical protein